MLILKITDLEVNDLGVLVGTFKLFQSGKLIYKSETKLKLGLTKHSVHYVLRKANIHGIYRISLARAETDNQLVIILTKVSDNG